MKYFIYCIFFTLFSFIAKPIEIQAEEPIHTLFIGNSFTYYHDLPEMVSFLAKAGNQRPIHHDKEAIGGYTLEKHWEEGKALTKIESQPWDIVILQDHSQSPLLRRDSMLNHGKKFDGEIKKRGAKTILYMTWALQNKPEEQSIISQVYLDLAKELQSDIAPVGNGWELALQLNEKLILHDEDQNHPNKTGTYLAACVLYATIYDTSPEGLPGTIGDLTDEEALSLQRIAWKTVQAKKIAD